MTESSASHFVVQSRDGNARAGLLQTDRGTIHTPTFMCVGTLGGVKAVTPWDVANTGTVVMLGNTYHLLVRPGAEVVADLGGLHRFSGWSGPMLTDSGGFQVFSLAKLAKTTEEGVSFANHVDGNKILMTPESSIEAQRLLGADIVMQFDDVPALPSTPERIAEACQRSARWAARCKAEFKGESAQGKRQILFAIQQGGLDAALREESINALVEIGFDGYAIGGLSVGESQEEMHAAFHDFAPLLPAATPRYVMGIGYPEDVLEAIAAGIDMMDCVVPTRSARHGLALTRFGRRQLKNAEFERDAQPLDPLCRCATCQGFSRGYLRHLIKSKELLGYTLLTIHNLAYYADLVKGARSAIEAGNFDDYYQECHRAWSGAQEHN